MFVGFIWFPTQQNLVSRQHPIVACDVVVADVLQCCGLRVVENLTAFVRTWYGLRAKAYKILLAKRGTILLGSTVYLGQRSCCIVKFALKPITSFYFSVTRWPRTPFVFPLARWAYSVQCS